MKEMGYYIDGINFEGHCGPYTDIDGAVEAARRLNREQDLGVQAVTTVWSIEDHTVVTVVVEDMIFRPD